MLWRPACTAFFALAVTYVLQVQTEAFGHTDGDLSNAGSKPMTDNHGAQLNCEVSFLQDVVRVSKFDISGPVPPANATHVMKNAFPVNFYSMPSWLAWFVLIALILLLVGCVICFQHHYDEPAPTSTKQWQSRGDALQLLLTTAQPLILQCGALMLIVLEVFSFHKKDSSYLMQCNPAKVGWVATYVCEYAKAYVRSFPLVAAMVSLLAASRMFMQQYMYYQLLKRGVLLDFESFSAFSDPLYRIMLWCIANSFVHFILKAFTDCEIHIFNPHSVLSALSGEGNFLGDMQKIITFYLPAVFYLSFLASTYDLEERLVPLSKYMKDDYASAQQTLANMPRVGESVVAAVIVEAEKSEGFPEVADEAYQMLIESAANGMKNENETAPLSKWRLLNLWPRKFLMHPSWNDEESRQFRKMWLLLSALEICVMVCVFFYFVRAIVVKIEDVSLGQHSDVLGVIVLVAHIGFTSAIAFVVLTHFSASYLV